MWFWFLISVLVVFVAVYVHRKIIENYDFFEKRGISVYKEYNVYKYFLLVMSNRLNMFDDLKKQYHAKEDEQAHGMYFFRIPYLMVKDPDLLKQILIKNFDHFTDHVDVFVKHLSDPILSKNLFALRGKQWHEMRSTLSPAFTGSKMRFMYDLINECGEQLIHYLDGKFMEDPNKKVLELNFKDLCTKLTNDAIATVAFGAKVDSLTNPNNEFYKMGQISSAGSIWRFALLAFFPWLSKLGLRIMPGWVYKFFDQFIKETIKVREEKNIIRPDMIHLLLQAKKGQLTAETDTEKYESLAAADIQQFDNQLSKTTKAPITDEDILAQAFVFFVAGYANVAITMCWAAYELAVNPDVQQTLYDEITKNKGPLTYDVIMKMKYLDMVVTETLRKWSPAPFTDRKCVKSYTLKTNKGDIKIEPEMHIMIPVMNIQRDPKIYPNPEKFDPLRFSNQNDIKPLTYMPFGYGPRICIAARLVLLEVKIFLVHLLSNFELVVIEKTPIPPLLKSNQAVEPDGGFWMGLKKR